jgi:glycosyltransferase involved in cell wall biosynthesis
MTRNNSSVSVILLNWNHARYLERSLLSHVNQTLRPMEIIVVDDGSTDGSCDIINKIAASHDLIRLVQHDSNRGVNQAIATGMREARGEYIRISAADDLIQPDFFERSMPILVSNQNAGFCFSDPAIIIGESATIKRFGHFLSDKPVYLSPGTILRLMHRHRITFSSNTIIYRRDALVRSGCFLENLEWQSDWFINLVLALRQGCCYIPEILSIYRVDTQSYSAVGMHSPSRRCKILSNLMVHLKGGDYSDVAPLIRDTGLLPEYRLSTLYWLMRSPENREYASTKQIILLVPRFIWKIISPHTPVALRRFLRRTVRRCGHLG